MARYDNNLADTLANDTFVALDLEMTGVRADSQEVVEIAAVKFRGERVIGTFTRLVKPEAPLPYGVQVLTGIRPADLAHAPRLADVAPQLVAFVERLPIVGQSVQNDIGCLDRQGVKLANPILDTFDLATILLPSLTSYSLGALAEHFGIHFPKQHRAAADALATKQLFLALIGQATQLDPSVLQELNRLVAPFDWPLKGLFRDIAGRHRPSESGVSIRQALRAKSTDDLPLEMLMLAPEPGEPLRGIPEPGRVDLTALRSCVEPAGLAPAATVGALAEAADEIVTAYDGAGRLCLEVSAGNDRQQASVLPSLFWALANQAPVVLAAGSPRAEARLYAETRALADRVPVTKGTATIARLHPRSSYLCVHRWSDFRRRGASSLAEALTIAKTLVWLSSTTTGDGAELNLTDEERTTWRRIAAYDGCGLDTCPNARRGVCYVERARQAAAAAHLITTSQAALIADARASEPLLPAFPALLVDDAHRLEDDATDALGVVATPNDFSILGTVATDAVETALVGVQAGSERGRSLLAVRESLAVVAEQAGKVFMALERLSRGGAAGRGHETRLRVTPAVRQRVEWAAVAEVRGALSSAVQNLVADVALVDAAAVTSGRDPWASTLSRGVIASAGDVVRLAEQVSAGLGGTDANLVSWLNEAPTGLEFRVAPVRVAGLLGDTIFPAGRAAVLLSEALAVGGDFGYIQSRLGFRESTVVTVPHPESFDRRVMSLAVSDVAEPDQPAHQAAMERLLLELGSVAAGRILALCTSHGQLRLLWRALSRPLGQRGVLVLGQGVEGTSRRNLLQSFHSADKAILLATGVSWEEPDIAEAEPDVVVITRLPFAPGNSPLIAARSEGLRDPLGELTLPSAVLRFRQGIGRLGRSAVAGGRRGAVVIADSRILTKAYAPAFRAALPGGDARALDSRDLVAAVAAWRRGETAGR